MDHLTDFAESQIHDAHYLKSVTELGDTRPIIARQDIHSKLGLKLVGSGMHINSSTYKHLLNHKLVPPLDHCLATEGQISNADLAEAAIKMLQDDPRLASVQSVQLDGWTLPLVIEQIPLNHAIAFKLTVMRETQSDLFEHSLYVALVSTYIGMQLKLDKSQLVELATSALLHDIGILHVDPLLLARDHKMTEVERRHLYVHPITSWMILTNYSEYSSLALEGVMHHHERLDGSGYPRGLRANEISLFGQIIAIAEIIASRYSKSDVAHGSGRLETILKLNLRRYGWNLVRHLKVFYQKEGSMPPPCSLEDKQNAREKMQRIAEIFASWELAKNNCYFGDPICAFIDERVSALKMEIIDAGIDPNASDDSLMVIEEDAQACFDARTLLDETLWQLHNVVQGARRRWPELNNEIPKIENRVAMEWLEKASSLL